MSKVMRSVLIMVAVIGVMVTLAVLASACGSSSSSATSSGSASGAPRSGGDLVIARIYDILTLDTTQMTDNESIWTAENIFDTLYQASPDGKSLQPDLATSYTLSSNHLVWTFHLRQGVKFSNGQPLTSKDVRFSILRVASKASNPFAFIDSAIASITTPDANTVVITTKYPWAPLLSDVALFANSIVPYNYGGQSESSFFAHPVGSGPFKFSSWVKGQRLTLVRNPYYWQAGKPYLDSVTLNAVTNDNTRTFQIEGGQAQIDEFPPFSSIAQLKGNAAVTVDVFPSSRTDFLQFNNKAAPFNDVHVRRAVSEALDRKAFVKAVLFGYGTPANSILSPALWAYDPNSPGLQYNLAAAKQEMAQSSVPHGFRTTLLVGSGVATEQSLGQIIQSELKLLGITVTLTPVDPSSEYSDIENGQYKMAFNYDTTDIIDPDEMVSFGAMGGNTGQDTHALFTNWNNPTVDSLAQQAERTFDQASRQALYNRLQVLVDQGAPMAFLYYSPFVYAVSKNVHGFQVFPTGNYLLQNVWLSH
jgi:peptide/nickel transport system substrate-binding protein